AAHVNPVAHRLLDVAHDDPDLPHRSEQPAHRLLPSRSELSTLCRGSRPLDSRSTSAGRGRTEPKSPACLCPGAAGYALSMLDLGRTFLATVERSPGATAIADGERRLGYASWYEEIARLASALTELGLRPAPSRCHPAEPARNGEPALGMSVRQHRHDA